MYTHIYYIYTHVHTIITLKYKYMYIPIYPELYQLTFTELLCTFYAMPSQALCHLIITPT